MPINEKILQETSFAGGLHVDMDAFQLGTGYSPDLLDVDCDPRGGVAQRGAFRTLVPTVGPTLLQISALAQYQSTAGTQYLVMFNGRNALAASDPSLPPDSGMYLNFTSTARPRTCVFNDKLYIQNGTDDPRSWNGSSVATLDQTANDDLTAPNAGSMPVGYCITAWGGYVWVANTTEDTSDMDGSTRYKSRLRWSHPNTAEDWRYLDYIDVDIGHDSDEITALVPLADRLLVFKRRSVYVVTGYDPDTFSVNYVANVGAISQEAVVQTEAGVYFFSWPDGVHVFTEAGVRNIFAPLHPMILDGDIPGAYHSQITGGWINRRVWFSVPWGNSTKNARTLVFDPTSDGWVMYSRGFDSIIAWRRSGNTTLNLAATTGEDGNYRILQLDVDADQDRLGSVYCTFPGTSGNYASAPDNATNSISGDLDIMAMMSHDWNSTGSERTIAAKWVVSGNQRSWRFYIDTSGYLKFSWTTDGSTVTTATSTATLPGTAAFTNGQRIMLRVVHDVDNGAAQNTVKFYAWYDGSSGSSGAWAQIGSTVTTAGVTSHYNSTADVTIGAYDNTTLIAANYYWVKVFNSIQSTTLFPTGTPTYECDFSAQDYGTDSWSDAGGTTWTLNGTLALTGSSPAITSYYRTRWFDAGTAAQKKRWRRPTFVLDADNTATLAVNVYQDYDPLTATGSFNLAVTDLSVDPDSGAQVVLRGGSLGRARSVQLKVSGPSPSKRWAMNAIAFKFIPLSTR